MKKSFFETKYPLLGFTTRHNVHKFGFLGASEHDGEIRTINNCKKVNLVQFCDLGMCKGKILKPGKDFTNLVNFKKRRISLNFTF